MSVPGRVGIIIIVALAMIDGLILAGGARRAATAIEAGALVQVTEPAEPIKHDTLLSAAIREILSIAKPAAATEPLGI